MITIKLWSPGSLKEKNFIVLMRKGGSGEKKGEIFNRENKHHQETGVFILHPDCMQKQGT